MSGKQKAGDDPANIFTEMLRIQGEAAREMMRAIAPGAADEMPDKRATDAMGEAMVQMYQHWFEMLRPEGKGEGAQPSLMTDPSQWLEAMQALSRDNPLLDPARQQDLLQEAADLWRQVLAHYTPEGKEADLSRDGAAASDPHFPRFDRRFANPAWRGQPVFALIHQTYLLLAERIGESVDRLDGMSAEDREQLRFATKNVLDAMSPANFPLMNPEVLERTLETRGKNLVTGMERLSRDLEKGQLTHTDEAAFKLGENVAATPGKVVYETPLFQLLQYTPVTEKVMETPLMIFPPWINRFYILDLNPRKSFVRWAVENGITVFMVSWKSADESLADIVWDDYIRAQIEAIDVARERCGVDRAHTIGYCVGGTTLAATLAILARRGEADKVASATFFTAQVDFSRAGDLKLFIDDGKLEFIRQASKGGYLDGRYMAATFNMLRGSDLIWNYVVNHYLLGENYPAFDLLYWNSDVTNLPAKWHAAYLRDLYRDNLLIVPDAMVADGTPIDLSKFKTPCYVQAGREDHIAPLESVFKLNQAFSGPVRFVLAGSGHIAGVVNPPSDNKYQYWTGPDHAPTLEAFLDAAEEHPGSWWPDWLEWLRAIDSQTVPAKGARKPGSKRYPAIEDAPGRYVKMR